jgi:NodT family efflux transporter outer membrane factor (OMF) lipoprotein
VTQWRLGAGARWEIDAFGRLRRNIEAAEARFEATIEDYRDVQVSVYAAVAGSYLNVRALQARVDYARQNADAQRESLELTRDRYEAGLTSALDVAQAEQNLAQTESTIPQLDQALVASKNRLAVLLGLEAGALEDEMQAGRGELPEVPRGIIAGVPADLVRRRPDIRRAERFLAAQTADIGVATADLYPTFSIDGFIETVAGTAGDLSDGDSVGWSILPGFRWDVFAGGSIRANIRAAEARARQALISYQGTVLIALEEVNNGLVAYDRELVRRDRLREAVDASQRAVDLVRTQYLSGLTNFQNLLDTQRSLFRQQDDLADSEGRVVQNLVFLNRALGGGWSLEDPSLEEPPPADSETQEAP